MPTQMSQQEIDAMEERLVNAFNSGAINAKQLADGLSDARKGLDGYTAAMKASLNQFQTSLTKLGAGIVQGQLGQSQYNDAINSGTNAIAQMAAQAGPLGIAFGVLLKVITFGITEVNKMADNLYKANNDLVKSGLAGFDMSGVFDQMRQFGYGMDQLGNMTALLKENSQVLAQFGGDAVTGAKKLAGVSAGLGDLRIHFMNMGMSIDDINSGIAGYIKQQTALGASQRMTDAELRKGSAAYLENMSRLSKLTGESADSLAKQLDRANLIDAWSAHLSKLEREGKGAEAQRLRDIYSGLASKSQDAAEGFAASASGFIGLTDNASKLNFVMGGMQQEVIRNTKLSAIQSLQMMADATKQRQPLLENQALMNAGNDVMFRYVDTLKIAGMAEGKWSQAAIEADKNSKETTDKGSAAYIKMLREQMSARDSMQDLVKSGIVPVTESMETLASVINTILNPFGKQSQYKGAGQAAQGAQILGSADARKAAEEYLGKKMSDAEYSALIKATHAESSGGKGNQQEQAMIMASILNRARTNTGGVIGALEAKNQFQAVTGTKDNPGPSKNYLTGPDAERQRQIEGGAALLANISKNQKNFTAASSAAYGAGTNIGYRDQMIANGGQVIGGTVFATGGYKATNPGASAQSWDAIVAKNQGNDNANKAADVVSAEATTKTAQNTEELIQKQDKTNALLKDLITINRNK